MADSTPTPFDTKCAVVARRLGITVAEVVAVFDEYEAVTVETATNQIDENGDSDVCKHQMWRVTHIGSRWGIQSWGSRTPADLQAEALNRVLPDVDHFVEPEVCPFPILDGSGFCSHHQRSD